MTKDLSHRNSAHPGVYLLAKSTDVWVALIALLQSLAEPDRSVSTTVQYLRAIRCALQSNSEMPGELTRFGITSARAGEEKQQSQSSAVRSPFIQASRPQESPLPSLLSALELDGCDWWLSADVTTWKRCPAFDHIRCALRRPLSNAH